MKHFSHPHELQLQSLLPPTLLAICSCCQLPPFSYDEPMYVCMACSFFLHLNCAKYPELITHPFHKNHTMALLPTAAYPGGAFNCDACNRRGTGFSYHCSSCEYDLHVTCASKPLHISLTSHSCLLDLSFANPYVNAKGFSCDVCHKIGFKEWLYRCCACDYDVHMNCAATQAAQNLAMSSGHSQRAAVQAESSPFMNLRPIFVDGASFGQSSSVVPGLVEDGSISFSREMVQEMIGGYLSSSDGADGLGAVFGGSPDQHETRKSL